jgi:hypothetical protein
MKRQDIEQMNKSLRKLVKEKYEIPLSSKIGDFFENILIFMMVCLYIIFRPINLIIAGIVLIIILLI